MNLTLDAQMDRLFVHGIHVMLENREKIEYSWLQMQKYLRSSGKKVADTMEKAIDILSNHLFHSDFMFNEEMLLVKIKYDWQQCIGSNPSNPFVLTTLENTVHRALREEKTGKETQAIQDVFTRVDESVLYTTVNNQTTM